MKRNNKCIYIYTFEEMKGISMQKTYFTFSSNFVSCQFLHDVILNVAHGQRYAFAHSVDLLAWLDRGFYI